MGRLFHIVLCTGFVGLLLKLYKPSESNMLFDGASLVLYTIATAMYISNIVKGFHFIPSTPKAADADSLGDAAVNILSSVTADASATASPASEDPGLLMAALTGDLGSTSITWTGREESLRVFAASNAILSLVLCGVLVLQAGQWYAERKEAQELKVIREQERIAKKESREGLRSPTQESRKSK